MHAAVELPHPLTRHGREGLGSARVVPIAIAGQCLLSACAHPVHAAVELPHPLTRRDREGLVSKTGLGSRSKWRLTRHRLAVGSPLAVLAPG
jgi:hypothetical protein